MTEIKNVLLINPLENYPTRRVDMYPSGALVLMGTMLNELGHNVKIVHMASDKVGMPELKDIVISFEPAIVGITMNTFQTKYARRISDVVKGVDKNILVVVGGPHPSALKLKIFDDFPCVDVAVIGEGEYTFLEIVGGRDLEEIKGICFGKKINEARERAKDLNHIPLPNLDLVGFNGDKFPGANPVGAHPSMYIMASRGCPYQCTFCNKSIWGSTTVFREPESIVREIQWLHEQYGVKEVFFQDDTFNLNRKWAERILNLIIENKLNKDIIYKTPFRANQKLVDEDLLRLAKEAGFWLIFYGVESGNQEMLDRMRKGLRVRELKRAFELTHKAGLKTIASFIIGLPGENIKTATDTFKLWRELKPYVTGYSPAIPFPDTEFEREVVKKGHLLVNSYDEYSSNKFIVRTDELTRNDLENLGNKLFNKMEKRRLLSSILNPGYLLRTIVDSHENPKSIIRRMKNIRRLLER